VHLQNIERAFIYKSHDGTENNCAFEEVLHLEGLHLERSDCIERFLLDFFLEKSSL